MEGYKKRTKEFSRYYCYREKWSSNIRICGYLLCHSNKISIITVTYLSMIHNLTCQPYFHAKASMGGHCSIFLVLFQEITHKGGGNHIGFCCESVFIIYVYFFLELVTFGLFTYSKMHLTVHPIENELKDPSQMKSIVRTSLVLCSSVYIATSFFGFLLFGDHTLDDILANFDGDLGIPYSSLLDDVVRVSYGIHLMLVFPIVFFSLRLNLDGLLFPYAIPIAFDNRRFFSVTAALMSFIFVGANFVPSIWDAFQITGATAAISVGFIFPAAVTLR